MYVSQKYLLLLMHVETEPAERFISLRFRHSAESHGKQKPPIVDERLFAMNKFQRVTNSGLLFPSPRRDA
jgi:hypothetical protein